MAKKVHPKVLVSDSLSESALSVFERCGVDADFLPDLGKNPDELMKKIGSYDGLAVRSATQVTSSVIDVAKKLRVIGRAGIGVDNIDVPSASRRGIVVMNTPFGNSVTTAEHTLSLLMSVARQIPFADRSTHAGKWEKSRFVGVELMNKVLGLVGCGNIGSIVAERAIGMKMTVLVYDPFLGDDRAESLGVQKVELDELYSRSDFITLHVPLSDKTRGIIDSSAMKKMKDGVRIINCARGGLVVESDLADALRSGKVSGAGVDVFEEEPAKKSPLFGLDNVVCTPHLGASTKEAQENVALQVAEQMSAFLVRGSVSNALNMPSISPREATIMVPFIRLAEILGSFVGQVTESAIREVEILYDGHVSEMNVSALTSALLAGLLRPHASDVNMVSAPLVAEDHGIKVVTKTQKKSGVFDGYIRLDMSTDKLTRSVAGTVFSDRTPRFIQIKGINMEAEVTRHMLYATNKDVPGVIGLMGNIFGSADVNIANFYLGRDKPGGNAISLLHLDAPVPDSVIEELLSHPAIDRAKRLEFLV